MKGIKIAFAAAIGAAFLAAPGAGAQDLPLGTANAKNVVEGTVTIDDQVYRVTSATRILGRDGRRMRLEQVTTEADFPDLVPLDQVTYAYAADGSTLAVLQAAQPRD